MKTVKEKRTRLSMKLLWKKYREWPEQDNEGKVGRFFDWLDEERQRTPTTTKPKRSQ